MKASEAKAISDKVFNIETALMRIYEFVKIQASLGKYSAYVTKSDFNSNDEMIAKAQEALTADGYNVNIGLEVITISWR